MSNLIHFGLRLLEKFANVLKTFSVFTYLLCEYLRVNASETIKKGPHLSFSLNCRLFLYLDRTYVSQRRI